MFPRYDYGNERYRILFSFRGFTPAIGVGIISLLVLGIAAYALYYRQLTRIWRKAFVINSIVPTQSEPAFGLTQVALLAALVALGIAATR